MKKTSLLLVLLSLVSYGFFSQESGYVEMKISSTTGVSGIMKGYFSSYGQRSEFDMAVPQMPSAGMRTVSIFKKDKPNTLITINDENKTYSEKEMSDQGASDNETYTVKKIGEETVNGYKCIHSVVTGSRSGENYDMWTSKDVTFYEQYNKISSTNPHMGSVSREKAMKDAGVEGFPVKIVSKSREGVFSIELVKMEKKDLPSSMFSVPAGYTKSESHIPGMIVDPVGIQKMTPEERMKFIEEMQKKYGGGN